MYRKSTELKIFEKYILKKIILNSEIKKKCDYPTPNNIYIEIRPEPDKLSEPELDLDLVSDVKEIFE